MSQHIGRHIENFLATTCNMGDQFVIMILKKKFLTRIYLIIFITH